MRYSLKLALGAALLVVVTFAVGLTSGTPHLINYQGKATDAAGNAVADGIHDVWFFLYTSSSGASHRWSDNASIETHGGLFDYILGSDPGSPLDDSLFAKFDSLFLGIVFDGEPLAPLTPLTSAPYAFRVNSIDRAKGGWIDGSITFVDTTANAFYAFLMADPDGSGAGVLGVQRKEGAVGFSIDGNSGGSEQPRVLIVGEERSVSVNLANSGNNSMAVPVDAIGASEMLDEPGVGSCVSTFVSLTTEAQNLCGRTMFAPTDGYVLVTSTANVSIVHNSGTISQVSFGVSDNISSFVNSSKINIILPAALPSGTYYYPVMSHALFPISQGSHAYYVLGSRASSISEVYSIQFTEVFFPTAYTTVHNPSPPAGASLPVPVLDPEAERLEADAFHRNRIESELARMSSELEKLKAQIQVDGASPPVEK